MDIGDYPKSRKGLQKGTEEMRQYMAMVRMRKQKPDIPTDVPPTSDVGATVKPKRKYTRKAKPVAPEEQPIFGPEGNEGNEGAEVIQPKPKRKYTRKVKVILPQEATIPEVVPIPEEATIPPPMTPRPAKLEKGSEAAKRFMEGVRAKKKTIVLMNEPITEEIGIQTPTIGEPVVRINPTPIRVKIPRKTPTSPKKPSIVIEDTPQKKTEPAQMPILDTDTPVKPPEAIATGTKPHTTMATENLRASIPDTIPKPVFKSLAKPLAEPKQTEEEPVEEQVQVKEQAADVAEPLVVPEDTEKRKNNPMNNFLIEKERRQRNDIPDATNLYPTLDDPEFNIKIAQKKEFADTQYIGDLAEIGIEKQAEQMCSAKFELSPHQIFVKNFLSAQTPYNGLLLYHGLGTGKTCSAIGVAEETRQFMKQTGITDKIIIVASPNVQANFRQQLFDERKLMKMTNVANQNEYTWNIESCVGNSLLREINPNSIRNISRDKLVNNINALINDYYDFMGYIQFANFISSVMGKHADNLSDKEKRDAEIRNIRSVFNNRLVIIDEVHNIRIAEDNNRKEMQQVAALLMRVAKYSIGMRLLLLSATPMFNSYKEIIWITNLLNINDKRSTIHMNDIFNEDGTFVDGGDSLLQRKLTGYISYVRGENPYTFPYRIYPSTFSPEHSLNKEGYPTKQMNGAAVDAPIEFVKVYMNRMSEKTYQSSVYSSILSTMRTKSFSYFTKLGQYREMPAFEDMDTFGYTILQRPLEALNITYPSRQYMETKDLDDLDIDETNIDEVVGRGGLSSIMTFQTTYENNPLKYDFAYKSGVPHIFSPSLLPNYSKKIAEICDQIRKSEGIVLIYSQYIDGGVIPVALALEEMGMTKYSHTSYARSLFGKRPTAPIDAIHMVEKSQLPENAQFQPAQYIIISGDKSISASNTEDVKYATSKENADGSKVKVVLISKAGSEGIDFKNIRQVHILEPWFNMNRIEQIIGRGVRNLSHCALPFKKRNVQIYLHATDLGADEEAADLYMYRLAEKKAKQIGNVSRILKASATDCILNIQQTNFTADKLYGIVANQNIRIELSTKDDAGNPIEVAYRIGDIDGSEICDYRECSYKCSPDGAPATPDTANKTTYTIANAERNFNYISARIKELYRENHAYTLDELERGINLTKVYPAEQIYYVLSKYIDNKNEYVFDKYGRFGYIINRGKYYAFQPVEINDERASIYERSVPINVKRPYISMELPKTVTKYADIQGEPAALVGEAIADIMENIETKYANLVRELVANIGILETPGSVASDEKNWYKNAAVALAKIKLYLGISVEQVIQYGIHHYIDGLSHSDKHILLSGSYGKQVYNIHPIIEKTVADYLAKSIMTVERPNKTVATGILLANMDENILYVFEAGQWKKGNDLDLGEFAEQIKEKYSVNKRKLNNIIGYMLNFKDQDMAYYFKDIHLKRNTKGRRCDRAGGKQPIIKALREIIKHVDLDIETEFYVLNMGGLCVLVECVLRYYDDTEREDRKYNLTPEQAIRSNITAYSVQ